MSTFAVRCSYRVSGGVLALVVGMMGSQTVAAEEWVTFDNETSTRLVADPGVGSSDTEEKDYAWADIDQDGDIDLVVVRKQEWTTRGRRRNVLFMNEGGVLVDRTAELASASTVTLEETGLTSQGMLDETNDRDVIFVDVNGDGWLDMVTATTLSKVGNNKSISHPRIYINLGNDGDGHWQGFIFDDKNRVPTMHVEPRFCSVASGDIDGVVTRISTSETISKAHSPTDRVISTIDSGSTTATGTSPMNPCSG